MSRRAESTKQRILDSARSEFLGNGFSGASLRAIAKKAGVTTGALYGYFSDKDALFAALVGEQVSFFRREFADAQMSFRAMDAERQRACMHTHSAEALFRLVDYMYDHIDAFRLVLLGAAGTPFEAWLEPVIALEEESTKLFIRQLRDDGFPVKDVSDELVHILCSGFFHDIMQPVVHGMDRGAALRHITLIRDFTSAGWDVLLGIR